MNHYGDLDLEMSRKKLGTGNLGPKLLKAFPKSARLRNQ
jgi:hypothetical protein